MRLVDTVHIIATLVFAAFLNSCRPEDKPSEDRSGYGTVVCVGIGLEEGAPQIWWNGETVDLPLPEGALSGSVADLKAYGDDIFVLGRALYPDDVSRSVLWKNLKIQYTVDDLPSELSQYPDRLAVCGGVPVIEGHGYDSNLKGYSFYKISTAAPVIAERVLWNDMVFDGQNVWTVATGPTTKKVRQVPLLFTNGQPSDLGEWVDGTQVNGMALLEGDLYVLGYEPVNESGRAFLYSVASGTVARFLDFDSFNAPCTLRAFDGELHVCGVLLSGENFIWKASPKTLQGSILQKMSPSEGYPTARPGVALEQYNGSLYLLARSEDIVEPGYMGTVNSYDTIFKDGQEKWQLKNMRASSLAVFYGPLDPADLAR